MKILLANPGPIDKYGLLSFYQNAFSKLGHEAKQIVLQERFSKFDGIRNRISKLNYKGLSPDWGGEALVKAVDQFKPDLVIVGRGERLRHAAIRYAREKTKFGCINIYPDSPLVVPGSGISQIWDSIGQYSCIYTFSPSLIPIFQQIGAIKVRHLPFACDPDFHKPHAIVNDFWRTPVAYLGAWGPLQERWLSGIDYQSLKIYGTGWKHLSSSNALREAWCKDRGMGSELPQAISGAKLVFNLVRAEHGAFHSMKTFEIPACGGFMLTNWTKEQAEFFENEKHCVYFQSYEEMLDKLKHYLGNESKRKKISEAGCIEAHRHTYITRASQILKELTA